MCFATSCCCAARATSRISLPTAASLTRWSGGGRNGAREQVVAANRAPLDWLQFPPGQHQGWAWGLSRHFQAVSVPELELGIADQVARGQGRRRADSERGLSRNRT